MTVIIDGTNGITDVDGSAATPALTGTDTNTGIFFPAADTIAFSDGGTETMRIDSSGNVGIGTTTPSAKLNVISGSVAQLIIGFSGTSASYLDSDLIVFRSAATSERVRIDSSGNVKLSTAGTKILNSSGNPILQQTGSVLQVVSAFKNDGFSSASTTFVDITGLTVSITPTSTTSKILILVTSNFSINTGNSPTVFNLVRNATNIATPATAPTYNGTVTPYIAGNISDQSVPWSVSFLDSPATTSATTYKVQGRGSAGTFYVNRRATADFNGTSTITVMEIAA